ncbi:MAG: low molecular weight phosphotyrosine protein phosphatase [Bacteroidales bacterium]|nr:low molecular weight phosphotyrosine protein phosphatase [Bacteroidales bacterium]
MKKVLFVCLGNICRSPAAEGMMREIVRRHGDEANWLIDSAGTASYHAGDGPDRRMIAHCRRRSLELDHICRKIRPADFERFDVIVAMDDSNYANLRAMAATPEQEAKIVKMADYFSPGTPYDCVPDPYYEGAEGFELVLDLLEDSTERLYQSLKKK